MSGVASSMAVGSIGCLETLPAAAQSAARLLLLRRQSCEWTARVRSELQMPRLVAFWAGGAAAEESRNQGIPRSPGTRNAPRRRSLWRNDGPTGAAPHRRHRRDPAPSPAASSPAGDGRSTGCPATPRETIW